jgi:predicted enzyme related to lactoylglutathione lyase
MKRLKFSKEELTYMPTVEHFKIACRRCSMSRKFYKDVFDWSMRKWIHPDNSDQDFWYFDTADDLPRIQ